MSKQSIDSEVYTRLKVISELRWDTVPKLVEFLKEIKPNKQRTNQQNRGLYLSFKQRAIQCREAGVTPAMAFKETMDLEMTEEIVKSIWKYTQKALYGTDSTADLQKQEQIDEVHEHLNRFFAEKFNLEGIDFPSKELDTTKMDYAEAQKNNDSYPKSIGEPLL